MTTMSGVPVSPAWKQHVRRGSLGCVLLTSSLISAFQIVFSVDSAEGDPGPVVGLASQSYKVGLPPGWGPEWGLGYMCTPGILDHSWDTCPLCPSRCTSTWMQVTGGQLSDQISGTPRRPESQVQLLRGRNTLPLNWAGALSTCGLLATCQSSLI